MMPIWSFLRRLVAIRERKWRRRKSSLMQWWFGFWSIINVFSRASGSWWWSLDSTCSDMRTACYYITSVHSTIETLDRFPGSILEMPVSYSYRHGASVLARMTMPMNRLALPRVGATWPHRCFAIIGPALPLDNDDRHDTRIRAKSYRPCVGGSPGDEWCEG